MTQRIFKFILSALLTLSHHAVARQRVAVLDFELNDSTLLPNTVEEQRRTESLRPLLEQALLQKGDYEIIVVNAEAQATANAGFGYLFSYHDLAAKLAEQFGADWVIVGQHNKPSFLYSHLIADLVYVNTKKWVSRFDIELKGTHETVTRHGVSALADKITKRLVRQ